MNRAIKTLLGDITKLSVDAIVNAANKRMLGGGGVDGAIHRAAGAELIDACRDIPEVEPDVRCPVGEVRLTAGFRLPANFVIHTVGPYWLGGDCGEPEKLEACYRNAMRLAFANDFRSIAFPAISTGVYGYPVSKAASVAVDAIQDELSSFGSPMDVTLVAFEGRTLSALEHALKKA